MRRPHLLLSRFLCLLWFFLPKSGWTWQWESASLEPDSLLLGQPALLTMSVLAQAGEDLRWPLPEKAQWEGWRVLGVDSLLEESTPQGRRLTRVVRLARYQLGEAVLPLHGPLGSDSLAVDSLRALVLAQLPDSAQAADILEPESLAHTLWWWLSRAAVAVLALLLVGWAWRRWRRRGPKEKLPPPIPPDPWRDFEEELERIDQLGLWRVDRTEEHYARLSLALRGLLEDCLGMPCRERSTEELRILLRDSPLGEGDLAELLRVLEENDWVKYARRWPEGEECARQVGRYRAWAAQRRPLLLERHQQRLAMLAAPRGEGRA